MPRSDEYPAGGENYAQRDSRSVESTVNLSGGTETTLFPAGGAGVYTEIIVLIISFTGVAVIDFRDTPGGMIRFTISFAGAGSKEFVMSAGILQTDPDSAWTVQRSQGTGTVRVFAKAIRTRQ